MPFKIKFILSFNILFLILLSELSVAQNKYWVEINENGEDEASIQTMGSKHLFDQLLIAEGAKIVYHSTFTNAYSVYFSEKPSLKFKANQLIKSIEPQKQLKAQKFLPITTIEYGFALEQIKAEIISETLQLNGQGVKIGVIDGGFLAADKDPSLSHLITNERIVYFSDYLMKNNKDPFYGKRFAHDEHGTEVLKMIAGENKDSSLKYGLATASEYYLARTDHGIRESRLEEDYWVMALESFYHMGIRLVNSSLGYTNTFDRKQDNHKLSEVDGSSSMITRAAKAAAEKGMLIVISAGNDGNSNWETLSLPADAEHVLSVGATDLGEWAKMSYSSIGHNKLKYIKPDVACFASNGTSYSAPIITGLAACIWQYDSSLTNLEIIDLIKGASHLAEAPNNYLGYGVPDAHKIIQQLKGDQIETIIEKRKVKADFIDLTNEDILSLVYYHKSNEYMVVESGVKRRNDKEANFIIERPRKISYTTISYKDQYLLEIEWIE